MIMAGRGRRLGDAAGPVKKIGVPASPVNEEPPVDVESLIRKIDDLNVRNINSALLKTIQTSIIKICTSKESLKDVLSKLYFKALCDKSFIEKLVVSVSPLSHHEVDKVLVRGVLLTLMQDEFNLKDAMLKSNKQKLYYAVEFLSFYFYSTSNLSHSIWILGKALLEYLELLLKGGQDELKVLTKVLSLNNCHLSKLDKISQDFKLFQNKLRNKLFDSSTDNLSKCWILLAIELMASKTGPLTETSKDFYLQNLGNEYTDIETYFKNIPKMNSLDQTMEGSFDKDVKKKHEASDITDKLIDMNLSPLSKDNSKRKKGTGNSEHKKGKKHDDQIFKSHKPTTGSKGSPFWSEHDDRFNKDENYFENHSLRMSKFNSEKSSSNKDFKISPKSNLNAASNE